MAKVLIEESTLNDMALKIQNRYDATKKYKPGEMLSPIDEILMFGVSQSEICYSNKINIFPVTVQ